MGLALAGDDLLTYPEFNELLRGLEPDGASSGVLQAWWTGEEIPVEQLHRCFALECRLQAVTPRARELTDRVLRRIEELHPEVPA